MIALVYQGKKAPFVFECDKFPNTKLEFTDTKTPVWVNDEIGEWLLELNPVMLVRVGRKEEGPDLLVAEAVSPKSDKVEAEEEEIALFCPYCEKPYKDKKWYDRHLKKCSERPDA